MDRSGRRSDGGGKSVFLNAMNFAFVTQAGLSRLPWLSIVDVGPSSSGLITLLRENLPEGKKHLAAYHRLRMTPDYAVNPFDTPLGCRKPLPSHKAFLVNLLSLLATPLDVTAPADGVPGLIGRAIDLAYEELSDGNHPRLYQPNVLPELHDLIVHEGISRDASTSWWEVVDGLFERGHVHEALQAQRYAMPLLADVGAQIRQNKGIQNTYEEHTINNVWRSLLDAIEAYVILKEPTRFDLGDAQIVSLDLDEVAPRGGATADRQSAVMYMLARHVLGSRFFLMPADVQLMPEYYQDYHAGRIEAIREDPKRLCYDEAHRVTNNVSVAGQLQADMTTMARESRKWNLSIGLYTQSIDDIPKIITDELATTVVILGSGTPRKKHRQSLGTLRPERGLPSCALAPGQTRQGRFQSHCPVQNRFGHVPACPQSDHRPSISLGLFHHHGRRGYPQQSLSAPGAVRKPCGVWPHVFRAVRPRPKWKDAGATSKTRATPMGKSSTSFWKLPTK